MKIFVSGGAGFIASTHRRRLRRLGTKSGRTLPSPLAGERRELHDRLDPVPAHHLHHGGSVHQAPVLEWPHFTAQPWPMRRLSTTSPAAEFVLSKDGSELIFGGIIAAWADHRAGAGQSCTYARDAGVTLRSARHRQDFRP